MTSLPHKWGNVDPDTEYSIGVGVEVDGDCELDVARFDAMHTSCDDRIHHQLYVVEGSVDGKTVDLKQGIFRQDLQQDWTNVFYSGETQLLYLIHVSNLSQFIKMILLQATWFTVITLQPKRTNDEVALH